MKIAIILIAPILILLFFYLLFRWAEFCEDHFETGAIDFTMQLGVPISIFVIIYLVIILWLS